MVGTRTDLHEFRPWGNTMKIAKFTASALVAACLTLAGAAPANATYTASAIAFAFEDISSTGTVIAGLDGADDTSLSIALLFTFDFFGTSYSSIFVSTNGLLTFGAGVAAFTNTDLTTSPTQAAIAPFWDDLIVPAGGVLTQTFGAPGSQRFVIQWNNVSFFSGGAAGDALTFEATLFQGSNNIQFNYLDLVSGAAGGNNGASATVGIKDAGIQGPDRLLLAFNDGPNTFVGSRQSTLIQNVPEPATLGLLCLALAGLAASRRRAR